MLKKPHPLEVFLQRELPGVEVQVGQNDMLSFETTIQLRVRPPLVTGQMRLDDLIMVDEMALHFHAAQIVKEMRQRAIQQYGLAPELEHARAEGAASAHVELTKALIAKLDESRDDAGNLPDDLLKTHDWLRRALGSLPPPSVTPAFSSDDLQRAERDARYRALGR